MAERALLHTRYRALVANLPDTVVTLFDPDLRIVVAEGAQLARRGLDADAYAGLPLVGDDARRAVREDRAALPGRARRRAADLRRRHARRRGRPTACRPCRSTTSRGA